MVSKFHVLGVAALCCLLTGIGQAQSAREAAKSHPGVVRVDWSQEFSGREPSVRIQLNRTMLRVISSAAQTSSEIRNLVDSLVSVQVVVYEDLSDENGAGQGSASNTLSTVRQKVAQLKDEGWESGVGVSDDGESVDLLMRSDDEETITGVAVFVAEEDELVFVNVAGEIAAEEIGKHLGALIRGDFDIEKMLDLDAISGLLEGGEIHRESPSDDRARR